MFESFDRKAGENIPQNWAIGVNWLEKDVDEAMREVRLALLEADVNFKVVKEFHRQGPGKSGRYSGPGEFDTGPADRQNR